jgi:hypothetical protein
MTRRANISLLLAIAGLVAASGGCADSGAGNPSAEKPGTSTPAQTNPSPTTSAAEEPQVQYERPPVRLVASPGLNLGRTQRAKAARAAEDFAVSLTRWLYGDRERLDVEPVAAAVRRELADTPPYIPPDQRGTDEGRVQLVELALQTERSGIVAVTINDLRTSYRIPAAIELRNGRWQIVQLNTH